MTPQPKPKTREEWERRLLLLEAARDDFARASEQEGPEFSERVAIKHGKNFAARSTVLDAIMSLQDEAERLRAIVAEVHSMVVQAGIRGEFVPTDFIRSAIEKARQANVQM